MPKASAPESAFRCAPVSCALKTGLICRYVMTEVRAMSDHRCHRAHVSHLAAAGMRRKGMGHGVAVGGFDSGRAHADHSVKQLLYINNKVSCMNVRYCVI